MEMGGVRLLVLLLLSEWLLRYLRGEGERERLGLKEEERGREREE
jgi:hypothetical protein